MYDCIGLENRFKRIALGPLDSEHTGDLLLLTISSRLHHRMM